MGIELEINPIKHWMPKIDNPLLIAGPCSLESEEQAVETAKALVKDKRVFAYRGGVWKPRTRPGSFEGIGSIGLEWLQTVRKETGLPVGTEVANAQHTEEALKAGLDILWIGARSTASPFVVQEIADVVKGTDAVVMVKNPVNPDVQLWIGALERLNQAGIKNLVAIHRGYTPFGETPYRNHPNWKTVIELRRLVPNLPIICDPSHIAGKREYLYEISQKAFDMGLDGLMIESHRDPSCALSDKEQQLTPNDLAKLLDKLVIRQQVSDNKEFATQLEYLRSRIDAIDTELLETLSARMEIVKQIGRYKKDNNVMALQINRWSELMDKRVSLGENMNLNKTFVKILFQLIHEDSVRMQTEIMDQE
ncbi:MAG: 3-deoxy-7-phosphoheptulonate synthase [Bacteroidetes bacterium GWF2_42_66]|nr:MAG: 3-deoxy-7-phosphoheptulonate synthase [Bacteroidetes bacterium GWA2_42_15]OFX97965.1 MAG: 3-deoxy-7-phosphoheptulonate synthase [Bacteroidetes bacterium GWE2_42_39]OFY45798.1 MAG: 3-deoxy-7-phosphoheptulonate synthase [Bacteroidetes bacterium GWF2_42_66]HBL74702.1 3-deoxy-7-phosphoheptulonate synthase [Prolixibacteraceae bacterium]HCR89422.1 3-deoxy-7-phosphoheptulonate synthase [Prolixibacteraceae bacterium]